MQAEEKHSDTLQRRVLFLDHTAMLGGGEISLLHLVRNLDRRRYLPMVGLFSHGPLEMKLKAEGVETHVLSLTELLVNKRKESLGLGSLFRWREMAAASLFVLRLSSWIKTTGAALVHTNSLKADIIGGIAARLANVPVLWHVRDRIEEDYLPRFAVWLFRFLCKIIPDYLVTNSHATMETLSLSNKDPVVRKGRNSVIHNGLPLNPYVPKEERRAKAGLTVGIVGRITPWKGQHIFLEAAAKVIKEYPDSTFQVIGSALFSEHEYESGLYETARLLGILHSVEFLGFCPDTPRLIAELDILVHASTVGEPFGQVIIEGMAAGKPVVATLGGGVPEVVIDGVTGIMVPMGDGCAMAEAVLRLARDSQLRAEMGRRGRERVMAHFTIEKTADKVMRFYDRIFRYG